MPDEATSNPEPANVSDPQAPETPISTPLEAVVALAPAEAPVAPIPTPESIPEEPTAQMGGNEPFAPAPIVETPITMPAPAQAETPAPETPEVTLTETTQPTPIFEPVATQAPEPEPVPAQVVATAVAPIVATTITQAFTKSMRELFTKALNARQNKKRKKLDHILSLFAKQTSITNNEVEKLLHISDSTATRYLTTLTKEGKIKQNTKKGQATSYSKI